LPEKYIRRDGLPLLLRHTGPTTLPQDPPQRGHAPPLFCLHDAGLQSSVFGELLAELEDRAEAERDGALAFDLPGHGRSGSLDSLPSIEAMAEMARWVAGWCEIDRTVLIGHGMGALVALEWAKTAPDTVAGLVLCGIGRMLGLEASEIEQMRRVAQGKAPRPFDPGRLAPGASADRMRQAYMEGIQTDPRATLVDLEACRAWVDASGLQAPEATGLDLSPAIPVRVLIGAAEPETSRARTEAFAEGLSRADLRILEEAAHWLPLEQAAAVAEESLALRTGT